MGRDYSQRRDRDSYGLARRTDRRSDRDCKSGRVLIVMRKAKIDRDGRSKADRACGVMEGRRLTEVVEFCGIELSNWNLGTLKGDMMATSNPNGCVLTGQSQQKDQTRRKLDWSEWRVRVESACVHKKESISTEPRETFSSTNISSSKQHDEPPRTIYTTPSGVNQRDSRR